MGFRFSSFIIFTFYCGVHLVPFSDKHTRTISNGIQSLHIINQINMSTNKTQQQQNLEKKLRRQNTQYVTCEKSIAPETAEKETHR